MYFVKSLLKFLLFFVIWAMLVVAKADPPRCKEKKYDYLVIGAGSAGAVVAKELSDDTSKSVLLIEAGPNRDDDANVADPSKFAAVFDGAYYNFDYYTNHVPSLAGRRIAAAQGRMWGGSSSHNLMLYVRGNRYDYDYWAQSGAGENWSAAKVWPVFKQMENNSLHLVSNNSQFLQHHGTGGRLNTHNEIANEEMLNTFSGAVKDITGTPLNDDCNGEEQEGVCKYSQFTQQYDSSTGTVSRESSSTSYLSPDIVAVNAEGDGVGVSGRKLKVHSNSFATKLIIQQNKVLGVEYIKNGKQMKAYAKYDVIVSAGAFQTPPLLMRSGIGNCAELQQLGIPCVHNNPDVGQNLHDHLVLTVYANKQSQNPLAYSTLIGAFLKSPVADKFTNKSISGGKTIVDTQLAFFPVHATGALDQAIARKLGTVDPLTGEIRNHVGFSIIAVLLRPKCKSGRVYISSKDPLAPPVIDGGYACAADDFEWASSMLDTLIKIVEKMKERDPTISFEYPSPDLLVPEYRNYTIRTILDGVWHYTGTSAIGKVVDENLCVKGVSGLRVADASVMPSVTSGNTNAPTMVIGKKAADIIKTPNSKCHS